VVVSQLLQTLLQLNYIFLLAIAWSSVALFDEAKTLEGSVYGFG
jgi:hypothetical protein